MSSRPILHFGPRLAVILVVTFAISSLASAQSPPQTEAQRDGFLGPIHSVQTTVVWNESVNTLVAKGFDFLSTPCDECEYARDGYRLRADDEWFHLPPGTHGSTFVRFVSATPDGIPIRQEIVGPFGPTEVFDFRRAGQPPDHETFEYDGKGRVTEDIEYGADGTVDSEERHVIDDAKNTEEIIDLAPHDQISSREFIDRSSGAHTFTRYTADGAAHMFWSAANGKIDSFWEAPAVTETGVPDSESAFLDTDDEGLSYNCSLPNGCAVLLRVKQTYLDGDKRFPARIQLSNADGSLDRASDFEYILDSHRNWTTRRVFITSDQAGTRTLMKTETRSITYYDE